MTASEGANQTRQCGGCGCTESQSPRSAAIGRGWYCSACGKRFRTARPSGKPGIERTTWYFRADEHGHKAGVMISTARTSGPGFAVLVHWPGRQLEFPDIHECKTLDELRDLAAVARERVIAAGYKPIGAASEEGGA